jgi:hypothetical protein
MASPGIRLAIKEQLATYWSACPYFDLSEYEGFAEIPHDDNPMLLLQFIGGPERLAAIGQVENHSWSEEGVVIMHLVFPTGEDSARALSWGEQLVVLFRGKRFGSYVIEYMEHFSDFSGPAIRLSGRWHGWSANLGYTNVICA